MRLLDPHGWPTHLDTSDPWDGASTLPDPDTSWEDHKAWTFPPLPDRETWAQVDDRWQQLVWEVLRGERPFDDPLLLETSDQLGLLGPRTHDARPLPRAPLDPPLLMQVDLVENWAPDLPEAGLDFVLGPYGDMETSRPLRQLAAAVLLFARVHHHGRRTLDAWAKDADRPLLEARQALKALERTPPMLWDCSKPTWRPLLPLMTGALPQGPVEGTPVPLIPGPVQAVVARVLPIANGRWVAHTPLGLPGPPDVDLLLRRLNLVLWRQRRANRRASWEDGLRAQPEVLYRTCATWWWHHLEES